MASVQINSPANGASVTANANFTVNVQWSAGIGLRKRKSGLAAGTLYTITCTGAAADFPTDDSAGSTSFSVMAGAAGTSKTVTVTLLQNKGLGN